jgi:uncharacterized repeat protein (TIGR03803 family)
MFSEVFLTLSFLHKEQTMRTVITSIAISALIALTAVLTQTAQAQMFQVLHSFTGGFDGAFPSAGLTMDATGKLYGTTTYGGGSDYGTAYQLIHNASGWHFNLLYSFSGSDGAGPYARVLFGSDGVLYGTTGGGGASGHGTVFSLIPPPVPPRSIQENHWTETVLYSFMGGSDGRLPIGDIAFDHAGNIYGAAEIGGSNGFGAVFKLTRSGNTWSESVLYSFTDGNDGACPTALPSRRETFTVPQILGAALVTVRFSN